MVCLQPMNVEHIPELSYRLLLLRRIAETVHIYFGSSKDIRVAFKFAKVLDDPSFGQLNDLALYAYRVDLLHNKDEQLHTVIAPEGITKPGVVDRNLFDCTHSHSHEVLLFKEQLNNLVYNWS